MSVQTWEAYELTGDFQGKRHSFHRSRSMAKRVLSHHALELFEVFAQRVPQVGKNGLQLGSVLCGYSLGTQFTDSMLQGYIERHKAPLVYLYLVVPGSRRQFNTIHTVFQMCHES
jgi:hypothetical protein